MTLPPAEILTERVDLTADDERFHAYRARPRGNHPHNGVVVAHELFGVTSHIREVCERLATAGYVAIAPDFYHRLEPGVDLPHDESGRERGFALLNRLRRTDAIADVDAAIGHLHAAGATHIGMMGLSVGGHIAYLSATAHRLDAIAALYPGWLTGTDIALSQPEPTIELTAGITGRILILCGAADHAVPTSDLDTLDARLTDAAVEHEIVSYRDTPHGFLCDRRETYRPDAANDAWRRVIQLFDSTLEPGA
ncbi:MAG TPA: dienelactone hydrolase family protein [Solirubrobacteraceae bacterium]